MRYLVLACDYDGTLAHEGVVDDDVLQALERCRASGRHLILVTGREMVDLARTFPHLDQFDYVVAENGATLYEPKPREEKPLAESPPEDFVAVLRARGVSPLSVGKVIVATWSPHETAVLETIRNLGLELQVIFNKGAVMVLPSGINKATGLAAALDKMGISPHNVVAVGDAENDHALLNFAEAAVAVANAVPTLLERADLVTSGERGQGVIELIDRLVTHDLAELAPRLTRHHILVGKDLEGREIRIRPYGTNVLISGTSGSGKSTLATAFLERLVEQRLQLCVIDPEGDYEQFLDAALAGSPQQAPTSRRSSGSSRTRAKTWSSICTASPSTTGRSFSRGSSPASKSCARALVIPTGSSSMKPTMSSLRRGTARHSRYRNASIACCSLPWKKPTWWPPRRWPPSTR